MNSLSETPGIRRAALLLHAMGAEDSRWVMARLADEQRQVLQALLEELTQLGIPAQPELIDEALGTDKTADLSPQAPQTPQAPVVPVVRTLAGLSAETAHSLLHAESEEITGRVLAMAPWPWEQEFLLRLPLLKQRGIKEARAAWAREYATGATERPVDLALLEALVKASRPTLASSSGAPKFQYAQGARSGKALLSRLSEFMGRA
jgi:hypothetical protein